MLQKLSLIAAAAIVLLASACSRFDNRGVVEKPFIGNANNVNFSVDKIELTDSSTVLHCIIHFRPGWWIRIADTSSIVADGKHYTVEKFDSIAPDTETYMSESGVLRFAMTFPPIPSDVRSIDFTENSVQGWELWDIDLTGKADPDMYMADVPSDILEINKAATLPPLEVKFDTTTVHIHIMGYRPAMGDKINWGLNAINGQIVDTDKPILIDSTGVAEVKFPLVAPADFFVFNTSQSGMPNGHAIVAPGETIDLYINSHFNGMVNMGIRDEVDPDFSSMATRRSNGIYSNLCLQKNEHVLNSYMRGYFDDYSMDGDTFTNKLLSIYKEKKDYIDADSTLSQAARDKYTIDLKLATAAILDYARDILLRSYYSQNGKRPDDIDKEVPIEISDDNYRAVAEIIDFNDMSLLVSNNISELSDIYPWKKAGIDTGILDMVIMYRNAYENASTGGEVDAAMLDSLRTLCAPMAEHVEAELAYQKALKESLDFSLITPTPDVPDDQIFDAIIAPHRGKVVMVDLWNTWCGPCRAALAENEPEKSGDLSSDDIVWIYIADESSPLYKYADKIKDIRGIHYRLNPSQIAKIRERFNVDGIPFYILVDRNGKSNGRPDLRDHSAFKKAILDEVSR